MIALAGFVGSPVGLRHALAFAGEIHRRCVINREPKKYVAQSLGLDKEQTEGVARLVKELPHLSPERLALVAMLDPGLDDADIAEMFGRSERWARVVREQAEEIKAEEPIPAHLEYLDAGLLPGDPMPDEIAAMASEIRRRPSSRKDMTHGSRMRVYSWRNDAFVCEEPV